MPYCPKCDMEFIDGITVCSDCGSPLIESRQAAEAMKKEEQEKALTRLQEDYKQQMLLMEAMEKENAEEEAEGQDPSSLSEESDRKEASQQAPQNGRTPSFTHVYVKKSQQYEDLKSSASAFFLVGGALTLFAALCWLNILKLPLGIVSRLAVTAFGLISLIIAFKSMTDAKAVQNQIGDENEKTQNLVEWFVENYKGEQLDEQILSEYGQLVPEELSLKRFDLIQDILITNHDLSDQAYVDLLAEEIYGRLYKD